MARFLVQRVLQALLVIWGVSTIVFTLLHFSGDPTLLMVPPGSPREVIELLRHQLGFDQPLYVQYGKFLWALAHGNLGTSLVENRPALDIVLERVPATLTLGGAALAVAVLVGIPLGIVSALMRGSLADRIGTFFTLLGQAMPPFWLGLVLILFLSVRFQIFPPSGADTPLHLVLPAFTLGVLSMSTYARMTRSSFLEEGRRDYIRTARAKGLNRMRIIFGHLFRNAAIPIISITALSVANLLGGAVVTESIFAWPGIGRLMIDSIAARDYSVVQAVVLVGSVLYVLINTAADFCYSLVDPRIRLD